MRKRDELADLNSCLSKAKDDEWLFVLLGRDLAAPAAVRHWVATRIALKKNKADDPQIVEALAWAKRVATRDVVAGPFAGAMVEFHFVNNSGRADCRFARDFGRFKAGEIVVLRVADLGGVSEDAP